MNNKITVIIPAYNEEEFIADVIKSIKRDDFVNDIIVVDNASTDNTAKIANECGANVLHCSNKGKGYAMEAGLKIAKNEYILYVDGDITNYAEDMVELMTDPLVNDEADFVKADFVRAGGRVTNLVALPLLELLFPNMQKFSQPLSGIIAGKKEYFQKILFEKDYGVDIAILMDMLNMNARAKEVNIGEIKNHSQNWNALEKMSKEVMSAILKRSNKIK